MKPATFAYLAASDLEEAVGMLGEHGDDAKLLAGGQSLVPLMNFRLARPAVIIDLNGIDSLSYVHEEGDVLRIGALTRHHHLATSPLVRRRCAILAEASGLIGYPAIRHRGTIGGSLAHADPAAELPCIAVTLGAELVAVGPEGDRSIRASDFFTSIMTTALQPSEVLAEVRIPCTDADHTRWGFREFSRKRGDFALATAAAVLEVREGVIRSAKVGLGGVAGSPVRSVESEQALEGQPIDERDFLGASEAAASSVRPTSDVHASSQYRQQLVRALTRRALRDSLDRPKDVHA